MTDAQEEFFQGICEVPNYRTDDGVIDIPMTLVEIGYRFTDEEGRAIEKLKAYHRNGSRFVEISHIFGSDVTEVGDLQEVLQFPSAEDATIFFNHPDVHVSYRMYDSSELFEDSLLRKIDVGTHLPVFVERVIMQKERFSSIELTHTNENFNTRGRTPTKGKILKDFYYGPLGERFGWVEAGGHGSIGDPVG
jgi:hypothetical protein